MFYAVVEYVSEQRPDGEQVETEVLKNAVDIADVRAAAPDGIVISPGPGHPKNDRDVGVTMPVLRELSPEVPTLGVCLGLEAAVYEYGGSVGHAPEPIHGKAFPIDCVQFHPESVLTGVGHDVTENFPVEFVA